MTYRPDWWPRSRADGAFSLLTILDVLHRRRPCPITADSLTSSDDGKLTDLCVQCLSHACRTWRSPSTPYESALYNLCLAAIDEANNHAARAAAKETK